jgi:hypothetical protein
MAERWQNDPEGFLAEVAKRTEDITLPEDFADRVMARVQGAAAAETGTESVDDKLARLADQTKDLRNWG